MLMAAGSAWAGTSLLCSTLFARPAALHFNKQSLSSAALFCHSTVKARLRLVAVVQQPERMLCSHQQALNAGPERCTRAQLHAGRRAPKVCTCRRNDLQPGLLTHSLTQRSRPLFNLDATCRGVLITGQLLFFAQKYIPPSHL